jgi:hypothetical protein
VSVTYKQKLAYLHKRLHAFPQPECREAAAMIADAIGTQSDNPALEIELQFFHGVWGRISKALDVSDLTVDQTLALDAIESELAGHVLTARLAKGDLVRATH